VEGLPSSSDFRRVWGSSLDDVYAAGGSVLMRFDGDSWSEVSIPGVTPGSWIWQCVDGTGFANVFVGAMRWENFGRDRVGKVFHFDGASWLEVLPEQSKCGVDDIWARAAAVSIRSRVLESNRPPRANPTS